jgi:hypothetical protein
MGVGPVGPGRPGGVAARRPQPDAARLRDARSHKVSSRRPPYFEPVPGWSRAAARDGCGVRGLGPCGGSGPGPSPDLAIAHRVGPARAGGRRGHRPPRAGPGPQASAATSRRRRDRQATTSPPGTSPYLAGFSGRISRIPSEVGGPAPPRWRCEPIRRDLAESSRATGSRGRRARPAHGRTDRAPPRRAGARCRRTTTQRPSRRSGVA